jgi:hypothetical protein
MLHHFAGPPPAEWLARRSDSYVVAVKLPLKPADMPRHSDGSVDIAAFPERIFGPERVVRHPDGSVDLVDVPEGMLRPVPRVLHRATCESLRELGDEYQVICGTRDELERDVMDESDGLCPGCL